MIIENAERDGMLALREIAHNDYVLIPEDTVSVGGPEVFQNDIVVGTDSSEWEFHPKVDRKWGDLLDLSRRDTIDNDDDWILIAPDAQIVLDREGYRVGTVGKIGYCEIHVGEEGPVNGGDPSIWHYLSVVDTLPRKCDFLTMQNNSLSGVGKNDMCDRLLVPVPPGLELHIVSDVVPLPLWIVQRMIWTGRISPPVVPCIEGVTFQECCIDPEIWVVVNPVLYELWVGDLIACENSDVIAWEVVILDCQVRGILDVKSPIGMMNRVVGYDDGISIPEIDPCGAFLYHIPWDRCIPGTKKNNAGTWTTIERILINKGMRHIPEPDFIAMHDVSFDEKWIVMELQIFTINANSSETIGVTHIISNDNNPSICATTTHPDSYPVNVIWIQSVISNEESDSLLVCSPGTAPILMFEHDENAIIIMRKGIVFNLDVWNRLVGQCHFNPDPCSGSSSPAEVFAYEDILESTRIGPFDTDACPVWVIARVICYCQIFALDGMDTNVCVQQILPGDDQIRTPVQDHLPFPFGNHASGQIGTTEDRLSGQDIGLIEDEAIPTVLDQHACALEGTLYNREVLRLP